MKRIQFLLSTTLLGCAVVAHPAFAQNAPAPAAAQPQVLQEVVVTAEHRTSTAQKTAASVSVRSGKDMLTQGRYQLADIIEDVPGISGGAANGVNTGIQGLGSDNPATSLVIRGVPSNTGAGGSAITTAASAAIYVDDVYNGIGGSYDLDRVEVLRGPQGTLYGRSATAGVVAIHTGDPNTTALSGQVTAEYGNYDLRHVTGDVNVPLIQDKLAVRLSGNEYERDGYYSADGGAVASADTRVKVLWTPTDNFSALLGYAQEYNVNHTGGISIDPQSTYPSQGNAGAFKYTSQPVPPPSENNFHQYWGNFNLNLGPVAITYIPAYRTWYQNAGVTVHSAGLDAVQTVKTPTDRFMTQELRIRNTDNDAKLKWQAGFLYYDNSLSNSDNLYSQTPLPPLGFMPGYLFQSATTKSTTAEGGFAEATYAFAPDTRLTGGLRYDHTQVINSEVYSAFQGAPLSLAPAQGTRDFSNLTYKVRLEHDLTPRNLLYAMISTGASPGDVTITTDSSNQPEVQALKAETLTAYELGSKNRFLDNRLQVNGDVYFNDYAGFQTVGENVTPSASFPTFETLVSPMKSYGAELEVIARPWDNGTITANGSYTNARFGNFAQVPGFDPNTLFSTKVVPKVAPFQGSVAYDHRIPIGDNTLLLHGDVHFFTAHDTASIPVAWQAAGVEPFDHVPNEAVGDFVATLLFGPHYSISAYVRNIADTRFIPDTYSVNYASPQTGGPPILTAGEPNLSDPRTFGVILTAKY
jgi:iron complex outermembrane receptor protein